MANTFAEEEMATNDVLLAPLSGAARQQIHQILRAYGDFWTNIAFQKGWAKPVFNYVDVQTQLERAAEFVVRIRNKIDSTNKDPSAKLHRMAEGSAREYLWTVMKKPVTEEEKQAFFRGVVHANFCDASGYVEGLSKEEVDRLIDCIANALDEQNERLRKETELEEQLVQAWEETSVKIKELRNIQDSEVQAKLAGVRAGHVGKILELLEAINKEVDDMQGARTRETELKRSTASPRKEEEEPQQQQQLSEEKPAEEAVPPSPQVPRNEDDTVLLEVQKVAEQVASIKGEIKDLVRHTDMLREKELALQPEAAAKEIEDLQYKCMKYANMLMNDLLALDSMVGSSKARPLKKEQVVNIQSMLEDVDAMKKKLMDLKHHIPTPEAKPLSEQQQSPTPSETRREEPEKEKEAPTGEKEGQTAAAAEPPKSTKEEAPTPMEEDESRKRKLQLQPQSHLSKQWRAMKLKPRIQVAEHPDCFVISTYVPQMKFEDIHIKCGTDTITVEGVREPTLKEESAMRNQLKDRFRALTGKEFDYVCLDEDEDAFLLQMGAGRFGRFSETYKVPPYVDLDNVKSLYQGGRLVIILPFKKGYAAPQLKTRAPAERGGVSNPFTGSAFLDDEDFWW